GKIAALDALSVINDLNAHGSRLLPSKSGTTSAPPYLDVNGDGSVTPQDALMVVNYLNAHPTHSSAQNSAALVGFGNATAASVISPSLAASSAAASGAASSVETAGASGPDPATAQLTSGTSTVRGTSVASTDAAMAAGTDSDELLLTLAQAQVASRSASV